MADNSISGVYRIIPMHPVQPPKPADKERDHEREKREGQTPQDVDGKNETAKDNLGDDDADDKPIIDEYV